MHIWYLLRVVASQSGITQRNGLNLWGILPHSGQLLSTEQYWFATPSEFTGSAFEVAVFWKTSKWLMLVGILSVLVCLPTPWKIWKGLSVTLLFWTSHGSGLLRHFHSILSRAQCWGHYHSWVRSSLFRKTFSWHPVASLSACCLDAWRGLQRWWIVIVGRALRNSFWLRILWRKGSKDLIVILELICY